MTFKFSLDHSPIMKIKLPLLILLAFLSLSCKSQKVTYEKLTELKELITSNTYPKIDAVLVSRNNEILIEEYFHYNDQNRTHQTRSSHKSITSVLAGIAIDQGLFTVDDEIGQYVTEWKDDPRGKITVKDLLEMRSGLACENFFDVGPDCESEMFESDDWLAYILEIPKRYEPGLQWEYTSMEPELVGLIITRTCKTTLMEFADKYLFKPLEIKNFEWQITPDGRGFSAGSSYMRPIDMLKISQLVLNKGKWKGKQIVSEKWIKESTICEIEVGMSFLFWSGIENAITSSATYGFLWYREVLEYGDIKTEVLFASGNGGQYMMVLEDYNTAVVFTGSNYGSWQGKLPFDILLKYIIPILKEEK